jgi:flavin reductase (DIM6/NTAB) family NADH-FMN oxidoreductase RutF
MSIRADDFKNALRRWASGVTIVTSRAGERVHGMTVSAFTSVSVDPPLVLICADKSSDTLNVIAEGGVFAVNVLARDQEELSERFAWGEESTRLEGVDWHSGATGSPLLSGVSASLDCRVVAAHDAGDHVIYVGSVEALETGEAEPLLYFAGKYRSLTPLGEAG